MKKNHRSILDTAFCSILSAAMFFSLGVNSMAEEGNVEEEPGTEVTETVEAPLPEPEPAPEVTEEEATPAEEAAPQETVAAPVESTEPEAPAPTESKEPEETAAPAEAAPTAEAEAAPVPTVESEAPAQPEETTAPEPTPEVSPETTPESTPEVTPEAEATAAPTPEAEEEETVIYMPAGTFSGSTSQMTVTVSYDDHTFPTGTTMRVTDVSKHEAIAAAEQSTEGDEEVIDAVAVDITFLDANNEEIQPEGAVSVSMVPYTPLETTETSTTEVIHKDDSGNTQVIDAAASAQNATFDAHSFSIYVISTVDGTQVTAIATYYFYGADNQIISTQRVKNGETVYAPSTPEKSGYKFLGWSYTQGVSSLQKGDPGAFSKLNPSVTDTTEVKLYPVFQQVYYVFFLDGQGRVSTTKEGVSKETISATDVTIPLDSTHSVTGWYTEAKLTNKVESVTLSDHNVTLYPKVEEGHYLYFASGEGASYVKPVFIEAGKETTEPEAPTRPGYTFKHWSTTENGSKYAFGSTISKDTTLHAVWDAKQDTTYTVIFWKQSVNDDKYAADDAKTYDYAESDIRTGSTGLTVSPSKEDQGKGYTGFTYNGSKSTSVTIKGDGTTILNVYYDRNLLTINFHVFEDHFFSWDDKWVSYGIFTGLYGQTLAQNGYKWPEEYAWYESLDSWNNTQLTFLDSFILGDNETVLNLYGQNPSGDTWIRHYKQNLDGTYSYNSPTNETKSSRSGTWKFTEKYQGFTVDSFIVTSRTPTNSSKWKPASAGSSTRYDNNLYIRYKRNSYELAYYNYNGVSKEESVLFEKSLSGFSSYTPSRPDTLPEAYTFQGWFKDKECTVPFNFNSTMPSNDVMIYAKWEAPTFTGTVHTTIEGTGSPMQLAINYGSTINENDLPTVKDADGNVIQEGSISNSVRVPKGNTWAGWATKEGDNFIIFNFNTVVYSDITLYPYYINGEKYTVTYKLGDGSGTVPTDSKSYAENSYADIQPATGVKPPTGKTFLYWSDSKDDKYYPGDKVKITGDLVLTAIYGDTSALTSITYHSNYPEGSQLDEKTTTVDKQANNTAITLAKADFTAPPGYYFAYWKDASGKRYDVGTNIGIDNTSANDLYAQWEQKKEITLTANSETFTYDGNEHTVSGVETNTFKIDDVIYTVSGFTTENPKGTNAGTYTNNILNTNSIVVKNGDKDVTYQFTVNTENGSLKITPKAVTVTANSMGKTYGTDDPKLTATVSGTLDNDTVSYSLSRAEGEAVGKYTITPTGEANQGNYTVTYETGTFTIRKSGSLTLTAKGYEGEYDGEVHAASASASVTEGTTISYQVGNEEWTTVAPSIKDVGEQPVTVKAENANYETASTTVTLKVKPKAVIVTANSMGKIYGEKDPELTAQVSGTLDNDTVSYTLSREKGEAVGKYTITPTGEANQGNYTVSYKTGIFTISKSGSLVLTAKGYEGEYDGKSHYASASTEVTEGTTISYQVGNGEWTTEAPSIKNVGEQTVNVKAENANYETAEIKVTLKVTPKPVTVTAESTGKTYGADDPELTATVSETLDNDTVSYTLSREKGEAVGKYTITPTGEANQGNYTVTYETGTFTIRKSGSLTLTAKGYEGEYDGEAHVASATASVTQGTTISYQVGNGEWTTKAPSIQDVGEKTVNVKAENANYETAETTVTLKVIPKPVTVTADNKSKTYDEKDPELTAKVSGTLNGNTVSYTLSREKGKNVGDYAITPKGDKEQGNYTVTYVPGKLTISKAGAAEMNLSATGYEGVYDGNSHAASASTKVTEGTTISYQVGNEEWTTKAPSIKDVGEQTVSVKAENANYETASITVTLKVTPKAVTVKADNKSKTYGAADPELTATVSGTLDNDKVRYTLSRAEGKNVGEYAITPSGDEKQGNYTVTYVPGKLTISKAGAAGLNLSATGYEGKYDGNSHAASASTEVTEGTTISYQVGNGEWTTEAPSIKNVGEQTVSVKAENANYETASTTVTLRVTPKAVTVTAENKIKTYGEKDPELTATVSGTLNNDTVRYTLSRAEGEDVGTYPITPKGDEKQGNYTVNYVPGSFAITAANISDENMFTVSSPADVVYNGLVQKQPVTVARVTPKPKNAVAKLFTSLASFVNVNADEALKDGTDYTLTYSENLKDVGTVTVTVKGLGNYTGTVRKTYNITPAPLKVTTSSAEKVYDGKPLTAGGKLEGLVNGEIVEFKATGSQTEIGTSNNTYTIEWGNTRSGNYKLTESLGILKVTARPEPSKPKPAASSSASAPVPAPVSTRFIPRTAAYPAEGKEMK